MLDWSSRIWPARPVDELTRRQEGSPEIVVHRRAERGPRGLPDA